MNCSIRIFLIAFTFTLLLSDCVPPGSKTDSKTDTKPSSKALETELTGLLLNSNDVLAILTSNDFNDTVPIESKKTFKFRWETNTEDYYTLRVGSSTLRLFISPGDQLQVSYHVNNILPTLSFTGKGSEANEYLKQKYQLLAEHSLSSTHIFDLPQKEFRYKADSLYVVEKIFFESYLQKHTTLPSSFVRMEQSSLLYDWATKLMEYPRMSVNASSIDEKEYFGFLNKTNVNDPALLNVYEYRMFLNSFIAWFADVQMKKLPDQNLETYEVSLIRMQMVNAHIQDPAVKNYLLASVIKEQVKYFGYKNCELLFKTFDANCTDPKIKEPIMSSYLKYKSLQLSGIAPGVKFEDLKGNQTSLESFLGSYIYIDVWATWCLPCKRESPFFAELSKKYKHKNIEFVSLSVDGEKSDWKNYLLNQKTGSHQYWIKEAETFLQDYQIKTIPRFIIIDPQGKIYDADSFRPSDPDLTWFNGLPEKAGV